MSLEPAANFARLRSRLGRDALLSLASGILTFHMLSSHFRSSITEANILGPSFNVISGQQK